MKSIGIGRLKIRRVLTSASALPRDLLVYLLMLDRCVRFAYTFRDYVHLRCVSR